MMWLWERAGERLAYEVRQSADGAAYELTITFPDGTEESERIEQPSELLERAFSWKARLTDQGWAPVPRW
jgi:hypothetical protein